MKLLDDIKVKNENKNIKWGIIKTDYDIYIGQFNGEKSMIPKNLKPGDTFEDGNKIYEVISVVKEGYISKRIGFTDKEISNMAIIDKSEPVILDEDIKYLDN